MLQLKKVTSKIEDKEIIHEIDFTFEKGKIYAVMGPNGSGKSTLAATVMGSPAYTVNGASQIIFENENIMELKPEERSKKGIFLSFQTPHSLSGVNIYHLLRYALDKKADPLTIRKKVKAYAQKLKISEDLLTRSLNEGFSGGEKKKMEVLQVAMMEPKIIFFDEIDTGVDIDALKTIAKFLKKIKEDKTYVLITHYNRILKYLQPDIVLIIKDGKIVKTGDHTLANTIEKEGYDKVN